MVWYRNQYNDKNPNWKGGKSKSNCITCETEFEYYPSCTSGKYCSTTCRKRRIIKDCPTCHNQFSVFPSDSDRIYCSRRCSSKGYSNKKHHNWGGGLLTRNCVVCEEEFSFVPSRVNTAFCCSKSCAGKLRWKNNKYREKMLIEMEKLRQLMNIKPNKIEIMMISLLSDVNIKFDYVGDGKVWIGSLNPDFVDEENKKIIEVFGDYWHNPELNDNISLRSLKRYRKKEFKKHGYKMLVIWEHELYNDYDEVVNKIYKFTEGD